MKTKHGDIPHIVPDQVKKQHEFLKEYKALCIKYGLFINHCNYDSFQLEIEDIEYNDTDMVSYINGIDLI